jgi:preprotein translocase subunit YajC
MVFNSRCNTVMMSGLWNDIVNLIGVLLIISLFFIMVASPEQIQQLLNMLLSESMIVLAATAIALILIIREYEKREKEW